MPINQTKPTLSIGIPTYNRPEALCRRLAEIEKFTDFVQEVVICDNSAETPGAVTAAIEAVSFKCNYIKNSVSIGGGANFLRVVENASTDYLWWRGDDDVISAGQAEAVKANITSSPRLVLISAAIKDRFVGKGIDEFVDNFDKVDTMGWFSSIVMPVEIAKKALPWGFTGIASGWANVTLVLGLFRVNPELEFVVVPFRFGANEFRDVGREGQRWAYFNTCIKNYPKNSEALLTERNRQRFIRNWRKTLKGFLVRKMVGIKLGVSTQEKMTFSTFSKMLTIENPRSTLLGLFLYAMSKIPHVVYQFIFALVWLRLDDEKKESLNIDFLKSYKSVRDVFAALRENTGKRAEIFL